MSKIIKSLKEAIRLSGLKSNMTISFHHNLRSGDTIAGEIIRAIDEMGIKHIKVAPSSLLSGHDVIAPYIKNKTIGRIDSTAFTPVLGELLQRGFFEEVCTMRTHGGRPQAIENGSMPIDVAFIAASRCDKRGNCNSLQGKSAFGSMGYSMTDARFARKVIVVTDGLSEEPVAPVSIDQSMVDYVVVVDSIGDPAGIASGALRITADPIKLKIAHITADVIKHSGYLKEGVCLQTGAGGISLAVAAYVEKFMLERQITGEFALGGITGTLVDMLKKGLFKVLYDVQCFDLKAVKSLAEDPNHVEISASMYANPDARGGCIANSLDCVILGGAEIDVDFNVNVHTGSDYRFLNGAGGHGDTAEGAKLTIITAPAFRSRIPTVVDRVNTISTPGRYVDVYVCQYGIAINTSLPKNVELAYCLKNAGLPVFDIHDLQSGIEKIAGKPEKARRGDKTVARIMWRDCTIIDEIKSLPC